IRGMFVAMATTSSGSVAATPEGLLQAFDEGHRGMRQERLPVFPPVGGLSQRREPGPVPADLPETGGPQRLLVDLHAEVIVLDGQGTIVQVKGPGDRRPLPEFTREADVETISPERRELIIVQAGVGVDCDETPARPQAPSYPPAHRPEFGPVPGV